MIRFHTSNSYLVIHGQILYYNSRTSIQDSRLTYCYLIDDCVRINLNGELSNLVQKFSEHYHDAWAKGKFENGWAYGETWSDETKTHPRLKPTNRYLQLIHNSHY